MIVPRTSPQFCILEYRTQQGGSDEPKPNQVILCAFLDREDESDQYKIRILVDPDWHEYVQNEDQEYIDLLLRDLVQRAHHEAETLFKHLCSLGVGPVVTVEVGTASSMSSYLSKTEGLAEL